MRDCLVKKKEVFVILFLLFLDQGSKFLIENYFSHFEIIPGFFKIDLVYNTGAAWSLMSNQVLFLSVLSIIALFVMTIFRQGIKESKYSWVFFSLVYAGILGNLGDRLVFGHVKDFLSFRFWEYSFPVFNVADICIVIGAIGLGLFFWKEGKQS